LINTWGSFNCWNRFWLVTFNLRTMLTIFSFEGLKRYYKRIKFLEEFGVYPNESTQQTICVVIRFTYFSEYQGGTARLRECVLRSTGVSPFPPWWVLMSYFAEYLTRHLYIITYNTKAFSAISAGLKMWNMMEFSNICISFWVIIHCYSDCGRKTKDGYSELYRVSEYLVINSYICLSRRVIGRC
jgi:hypothetical protein